MVRLCQNDERARKSDTCYLSDYALFYVYIQTEPKDPTQLWAGAAELAEINGILFYNFLEGIKAAGIKPKRVLLQTGGKARKYLTDGYSHRKC